MTWCLATSVVAPLREVKGRFGLAIDLQNKLWSMQADGHRIVLVGGPMGGALLGAVRAGCRPDADLTAEPLTVLAAALGRVRLLIGNDSGRSCTTAAGSPLTPTLSPVGERETDQTR